MARSSHGKGNVHAGKGQQRGRTREQATDVRSAPAGPDLRAAERAGEDPLFSIGKLAEETGLTPRSIRFYEAKGLLMPRRVGRTRIYDKRDRARLLLILRGKRLGFSLDEIAEYLGLYDADPDHIAQVRHLVAKAEAAIAQLERQRADIDDTLDELAAIRTQCIARLSEG